MNIRANNNNNNSQYYYYIKSGPVDWGLPTKKSKAHK